MVSSNGSPTVDGALPVDIAMAALRCRGLSTSGGRWKSNPVGSPSTMAILQDAAIIQILPNKELKYVKKVQLL